MKHIKKSIFFILLLYIFIPVLHAKDGVWSGVFDINGHGTYDFFALINGTDITAYTQKAKVVYKGDIDYSNGFLTTLAMYIKDGTHFSTGVITASFVKDNSLSGKWVTYPAEDTGNIFLVNINNQIEKTSEKNINKKWVGFLKKDTSINLSVVNNKISGKDKNSCTYYGDANILNDYIYLIEMEIASCGISDGHYSGMAFIRKEKNRSVLSINATGENFGILIKFTEN